jgi:hypothetical protein
MEPTVALSAGHPGGPPKHGFPKVGSCYASRITSVEGRLGGSPDGDSGSQVGFQNGVIQTSYEVVRPIVRSRVGDKVTMCVIELPKDCPPNDFRGVVYRTHNWRTKESWILPNSEHDCGGA